MEGKQRERWEGVIKKKVVKGHFRVIQNIMLSLVERRINHRRKETEIKDRKNWKISQGLGNQQTEGTFVKRSLRNSVEEPTLGWRV